MSQEYEFTGNERATSVMDDGQHVRVVYHNTEVVHIDRAKGEVTFKTGGWETATTRRRMNQTINTYGLPYVAYIKDYGLYIESHLDGEVYGEFPVTLKMGI